MPRIQALLTRRKTPAWLFYDFRGLDPIAHRVLRLPPGLTRTRRWFYLLPPQGTPKKLLHKIEPHALDPLPGATLFYSSFRELEAGLRKMLARTPRVLMQYSPRNAVPTLSRVDAGTVELIRSFGVKVFSSQDLAQELEATWNTRQLTLHRQTARILYRLVRRAFAEVKSSQLKGRSITEHEIQQQLCRGFEKNALVADHPPIVAAGAHSADPHFETSAASFRPIQKGDILLIDLWAKPAQPNGVYADITWTGYVGEKVPEKCSRIFRIVQNARDRAVSFLQKALREGRFPRGREVDVAARATIERAGFGPFFTHRTGHSIGREVHGNGANLDDHETREERRLIPKTCFSIEPGIYLPGEFGIRSEINVFLDGSTARITTQPVQTEIFPIFS
ncbi:MAG: aminopeptidase P family protein [Elusimicrobia bacterium]|nr:aminopeptidase P family protein [Elusimicrobiota bacterium]